MSTYRPQLACNFRIRFDESLTLEPEDEPVSVEQRISSSQSAPTVGISRPKLVEPGQFTYSMARVPKSGNFELPGYRQAATFNLQFTFRDLPIDPRTVSACAVEIHTDSIPDDEFRSTMRGGADYGFLSRVTRATSEFGAPNGTTLRMVGLVDTWKVQHNEKGSIVQLRGRDFRGVLLDTPINVAPGSANQLMVSLEPVMSKPINEVVERVLSFNPFFEQVTVLVNPAEWPGGIVPAPGAVDVLPRHRKGAEGGGAKPNPKGTGGEGANSLKFWDLITQLCNLVGAVPYFSGNVLVIRRVSTVFDKLSSPVDPVTNPTPFVGGTERVFDEISQTVLQFPLKARRLVWGRDIESLAMERKFLGWRKPQVVKTIALDLDATERGNGKVLIGLWPPLSVIKARQKAKNPGSGSSMEQIVTIPVAGVRDIERLNEIAHAIYEEMGRGEITGDIDTMNLASFGGNAIDPDLLRLQPGDGIEIMVDTRSNQTSPPLVTTLTDHDRTPFEEKVEEITRIIGDRNFARVIVGTARGLVTELQRFFRVQTVKYAWNESGLRIAFDFQNYVIANSQAVDASGDVGPATAITTPSG